MSCGVRPAKYKGKEGGGCRARCRANREGAARGNTGQSSAGWRARVNKEEKGEHRSVAGQVRGPALAMSEGIAQELHTADGLLAIDAAHSRHDSSYLGNSVTASVWRHGFLG